MVEKNALPHSIFESPHCIHPSVSVMLWDIPYAWALQLMLHVASQRIGGSTRSWERQIWSEGTVPKPVLKVKPGLKSELTGG